MLACARARRMSWMWAFSSKMAAFIVDFGLSLAIMSRNFARDARVTRPSCSYAAGTWMSQNSV